MDSYVEYAIESEVQDSKSSLNFYKKTLHLRKIHPALGGEGSVTLLESQSGVLVFTRDPGLVVVANTTENKIMMKIQASSILHVSNAGVSLAAEVLELPPNTTAWLQR
jgi:alpha-glucosidase